ncbi:MAG: T9SS type A sorting domain-containing protein [Flavobacteriia bacterium]|jgi:hypothetical protein
MKHFLLLFFVLSSLQTAFTQIDSSFCYTKNSQGIESLRWYYSYDKYFSYRTFDNEVIQLDQYHSNFIHSIKKHENGSFIVEFKETTNLSDRTLVNSLIKSDLNFDLSYLVCNSQKISDLEASSQTDDLILVIFNNLPLQGNDIIDFMNRNDLELTSAPNPLLNDTLRWTYGFRINRDSLVNLTSIDVARRIHERENGFTYQVEPNLYFLGELFPIVVFTPIDSFYSNFYPNPSIGKINIVTEENSNSKLVVEDNTARKIEERPLLTAKTELDYSHLKSGIYYFSLFKNGQLVDKKKLVFE